MAVGVNYETKRCLKVRTLEVGQNYDQHKIAFINMNTVLYARQTNQTVTGPTTVYQSYDLKFINGPVMRVLGGAGFGTNIHSFGIDNANEFELQDTVATDSAPGMGGGGGTDIDFELKRCMWVIELDSNLDPKNDNIYINLNNVSRTIALTSPAGNPYVEIHFVDGLVMVARCETGNSGHHSFFLYNRATFPGWEEVDSNPEDSTP